MFHAGRVDGLARGEAVATIQHHVRLRDERVQQRSVRAGHDACDFDFGVDGSYGGGCRGGLGLAHARHGVGDLALQIRHVHHIIVHQRDMTHARRAQVQRSR